MKHLPTASASVKANESHEHDGNVTVVDGWLLSEGDDGEARVRDLDLAERLGYERPRDIRQLVARLIKDGAFGAKKPRGVVTRGKTAAGEVESVEHWLTEAEALMVAAKSDTAAANEVLRSIVAVYVAWRQGKLAPAAATLNVTQHAHERLKELSASVDELIKQTESGDLRSHSYYQGECRGLIKQVAAHEGLSWQRVGGSVRTSYNVPGYRFVSVRQYVDGVREWLIARLLKPQVKAVAALAVSNRQLHMFAVPSPAGKGRT